jgi:hypothetical protein
MLRSAAVAQGKAVGLGANGGERRASAPLKRDIESAFWTDAGNNKIIEPAGHFLHLNTILKSRRS